MKKVNSQLLLACTLFVLLVVLCYSWVTTEMFQNNPSVSTSVALNNNVNYTPNAIEQHNVVSVYGSPHTKADPSGFNGLSYFQDFSQHVNSNSLPRQ